MVNKAKRKKMVENLENKPKVVNKCGNCEKCKYAKNCIYKK